MFLRKLSLAAPLLFMLNTSEGQSLKSNFQIGVQSNLGYPVSGNVMPVESVNGKINLDSRLYAQKHLSDPLFVTMHVNHFTWYESFPIFDINGISMDDAINRDRFLGLGIGLGYTLWMHKRHKVRLSIFASYSVNFTYRQDIFVNESWSRLDLNYSSRYDSYILNRAELGCRFGYPVWKGEANKKHLLLNIDLGGWYGEMGRSEKGLLSQKRNLVNLYGGVGAEYRF
ncbi:MAG: hypothetical protein JJU02_10660 [Cryomorphaceae bacterium]|nr:hypothetical protein [Cryomorphaceae bacterium]